MQLLKRKLAIETERLTLRPPVHADFRPWATLRSDSITYLTPWEPSWAPDHLSRKAFTNRVYWANRSVSAGTALPLFLIRRKDNMLIGAITLALLINISKPPNRSVQADTATSRESYCLTSHSNAIAFGPISSANAMIASADLANSITLAPCSAKTRAAAAPIPRLAPVIITVLPNKYCKVSSN